MPAPKNLFGAWREMRETWCRQQADPDYQFDMPLPKEAGQVAAAQANELEESIGELAPEGLRSVSRQEG